MNVSIDPIWSWPWWLSIAVVLTGLTIWTYVGVAKASLRRILAVLALRLGALLLAFAMVLRPSIADEEADVASTLVIVLDDSKSMSVEDVGDKSRWEKALDLIRSNRTLLKQLGSDKKVKLVFYRAAEDVSAFDPLDRPGEATGRRTDMGQWLHALYQRHARDPNLRALVIISDGADNGMRFQLGVLAEQWRRIKCPIHTFLLGTQNLIPRQKDLAFIPDGPDSITVDPSSVAVKNKLTVRAGLNVNGYANPRVTVRLFLDDDPQPAAVKVMTLETENDRPKTYKVELSCDAPPRPREMKVTLKVDPLPEEVNKDNNEISTYVTVTKEGLSVLYVEGTLRWEARFIRDAISGHRGLRLYKSFRTQDERLAGGADPYQFDKRHYDVIIIGDISAQRFSGDNPQVLEKVKEQVSKEGTGLVMLGGFETFSNSDWQTFGKPANGPTPIAEILPVNLDRTGSVPDTVKVKMQPTDAGLGHYIMRLDSDPQKNRALWDTLPPLEGMTHLGTRKDGVTVLAVREGSGEPILVGTKYGKGRTLAFACDSTWNCWRRTPETVKLHRRFWQQVVVWLAQQENVSDSIQIKPDMRRVAVGTKLGFGVEARDKNGRKVKEGNFLVKVIGPDNKTETVVQTSGETAGEQRGTFWKTDVPGEYRFEATQLDRDGKPVAGKTALARFLVYQDDVEFWRPAANPDVLAKVATKSDGKLHRASAQRSIDDEFTAFLEHLPSKEKAEGGGRRKIWPDWEEKPPSHDVDDQIETLWTSGVLLCFVLFVTLVCLEWFLRRQWGLV